MGAALAKLRGFVAAILEKGHGTRVIVTDEPWSFHDHVQPGERLFFVPNFVVPIPVPFGMWPLTVGAAEIFTAVSIYPEPLQRWGTWEAEKYFREQVLPLMEGRENRPPDWWQRPREWVL